MVTVLLDFEPSWISGLAATGVGGIALVLLVLCFRSIRGTTLVAPWFWTLITLGTVTGVEWSVGYCGWTNRSEATCALRFIAAVSTFCPVVAVLGAKRPQERVWQFAVGTLWIILALPAAESLLVGHRGSPPNQGFRSWFMLVLLLLHAGNTLATRFRLSASLTCFSQWCLLSGHLPMLRVELGTLGVLAGLAAAMLALALVVAGVPRRHAVSFPLNRLWLDFRDTFGMLWSLRVAERINSIAAKNNWNVQLGWNGFQPRTHGLELNDLSPDVVRALSKNLRSLLRRFVSKRWILQRIDATSD